MSVSQSSGLLRAMSELMPDAVLTALQERPWHSITFAGTQICLSADIAGEKRREIAADLTRFLPEHQFDLGNRLVADIAVTDCICDDSQSRLAIYALLLDD